MNAITKYAAGVVAVLGASTAAVVLAAELPTNTPNAPARLDEPKILTEASIPQLREARKMLNEAKKILETEGQDKEDHRKEAYEGINKAVDSVDKKIGELEHKM